MGRSYGRGGNGDSAFDAEVVEASLLRARGETARRVGRLAGLAEA